MDNPRDFVGYGANPPDPRWPGGAKVALNFVLNYEEGSELSIADGDGVSESGLTEVSPSSVPKGQRDMAAETMYEFGSRVGFWRLRRLFNDRKVPLTVFACALALERNPEAARAIGESHWDICSHGWRWINHHALGEEEERSHIARAALSIQRTTGKQPAGWYCRTGPGENTRRLVVEHGGFLYDCDAYNDEIPYWVTGFGKPHLVIPYTLVTNDTKFMRSAIATGEDFFTFLRESLDYLLSEGEPFGRMMSVGMHMRILGHPGRAAGLARFVDYVKDRKEVWICRRSDIAQHWMSHFPAPDVSA